MCSIGEDDFGDEGGVHAMVADLKPTGDIQTTDLFCKKCKNSDSRATYKLPFREAECRECFLHYARHKFRAALGSSKVLPKNANVLLVFDGSDQSMVLLDMLYNAQTQNTFKRLHCNCTVLYIDDYLLAHAKKEEGQYSVSIKNMQNHLDKYINFDCYIMPLTDIELAVDYIFNLKTLPKCYFTKVRDHRNNLATSINTLKSLTSRQDFVKHHRSKLLAAAAKHFRCQFVFMPDISSELASELLAAVALGRGGSAALDVALVDDRLNDGIRIVRPLKDLSVTEIALYIKAQDLQQLQFKRYGSGEDPSASLQNLTKIFVEDLQKNYSSTVSTVFRTGSKIATNQILTLQMDNLNLNENNKNNLESLCCSFCNSQLDYRDSTTLLAIEFSRVVSESGSSIEKFNNLHERAQQNVEGANEECSYFKKLCHACRNICADSSNEHLL